MMSTGAEGDSFMDEPIPEVDPSVEAVHDDDFASFLHTVRGMVHDEAPTADRGAAVADNQADKATRRHEEKLARAERRSARKSRSSSRQAEVRPEVRAEERTADVAAPSRPGRVPAQAAGPSLAEVADPDAGAALAQAEVISSRRVRRRDRRRQAVLAATSTTPEDEPALELALAEAAGSTGAEPVRRTRISRRDRRRDAARAVAASVPVTEPPVPPVDERGRAGLPPGGSDGAAGAGGGPMPAERLSRRDRRRGRRDGKALAKALARGESADAAAEPETLAEYLARVESPRLPRRSRRSHPRTPLWFRRTLKISAVVVLIAAAAVLPWAQPRVPDVIAGLVPGQGASPVHVKDPPVAPPTDAVVGPVGVEQQAGPYDGIRLEAAGWPREVIVERLHVDSDVVPISGQSGSLLPPSDPQELGWWKEGRPVGAQYGTAVVTGHTVHTGGGALDHLDRLVVGDSVRVRTDDGWITYAVQRTQVYSIAQLARDAKDLFRQGGSGRLVLITCDDWNGQAYESNAVVIATPVADQPS